MKRLAFLFSVVASAAAADSHMFCMDHNDMIETLEAVYGERVISRALEHRGGMVETAVNLQTGTWTLLATNAAKRACIAASGTNYQSILVVDSIGQPI